MKLFIMSIVIHLTWDLHIMYVSINSVYNYMFETEKKEIQTENKRRVDLIAPPYTISYLA